MHCLGSPFSYNTADGHFQESAQCTLVVGLWISHRMLQKIRSCTPSCRIPAVLSLWYLSGVRSWS